MDLAAYRVILGRRVCRCIVLACAAVAVAAVSAEAAPIDMTPAERKWVEENREITVFGDTSVPPFLFSASEEQEARGLSIDYLNAVFGKIGVTVRFRGAMPLSEAQAKLERKDGLDLIPMAARTPDNMKRWGISSPYFSTPFMAFSRADEAVIADFSQFRGRKMAYFEDARVHRVLMDKFPDIEWVPFASVRLAFEAVSSGEADGVIGALAVGAYLINEFGLSNLKVAASAPVPALKLAFAVHKDNTIFTGLLTKAIISLSEEERNTIRSRWLSVRFEHGSRSRDLIFWTGIVGGTLLIIVAFVTLSNRRLRAEIRHRKSVEAELSNAREAADSASRLKSEFLSMMSHELRTPLTSIKGALGLIHGNTLGEIPQRVTGTLDIALRNTNRLAILINDILDLSKIEAGRMDFRMEPLEIRALVESALEANKHYGQQLGTQFVIDGLVPDGMIEGDEIRLLQVFSNLMSNAAKFSPNGSKVEIEVSRGNGTVRFSVKDRGRGIPEEFRNRIFERFSQADSTDTRLVEGTGLGLNIAKGIVEHHGGAIDFETEVGSGTTFHFELPELERRAA